MSIKRRKVTFKRSLDAKEAERLTGWVWLHCEPYGAVLEKRIDA